MNQICERATQVCCCNNLLLCHNILRHCVKSTQCLCDAATQGISRSVLFIRHLHLTNPQQRLHLISICHCESCNISSTHGSKLAKYAGIEVTRDTVSSSSSCAAVDGRGLFGRSGSSHECVSTCCEGCMQGLRHCWHWSTEAPPLSRGAGLAGSPLWRADLQANTWGVSGLGWSMRRSATAKTMTKFLSSAACLGLG